MNEHTQSGIYDLAQTPSGEIIMHKFMHTPNEFPTALKDLLFSILKFMATTQEINMICMLHISILRYIVTIKELSYITRQYWNSLDFQLKREQSLKKFKNMLKENIITGYEKY